MKTITHILYVQSISINMEILRQKKESIDKEDIGQTPKHKKTWFD